MTSPVEHVTFGVYSFRKRGGYTLCFHDISPSATEIGFLNKLRMGVGCSQRREIPSPRLDTPDRVFC